MKIGAVIVAAGRGERAGGGLPKQYRALLGRSVLARTLDRFVAHPAIDSLVVVTNPADAAHFGEVLQEMGCDIPAVDGGATRTASVRAGLDHMRARAVDAVLIHDAARPFVSAELIDRIIAALQHAPAVIPALPVADALMKLDADQRVTEPVDRTGMAAAQTPQAFHLTPLLTAYTQLGERALPDDAAVIMAAGGQVETVPGDASNFKLTRPEDFRRAEEMLMSQAVTVTGHGFDVHRLEPAEAMWLCGIEIRAGLGLVGHSDADAALHAVTDAVLGAAGAGDIGEHFPPSDPQWRGAASDRFLDHAISLLKKAGGERLAEITGLDESRVNIKATTTERLGFTGRGEGLAAQATVTARLA